MQKRWGYDWGYGEKSNMTTSPDQARRVMNKLSHRAIQSFLNEVETDGSKITKLFDGGGMFLARTSSGTLIWRLKYRYGQSEKSYTIGPYPGVSLEAARTEREKAKALLRTGKDPVLERKIRKASHIEASDRLFRSIASDWMERQKHRWCKGHYLRSKSAMERDVFPLIGHLPVEAITAMMVSCAIERVEKRGARESAGKLLQHVSSIFRYAQAKGICPNNPALSVSEVLSKKRPVKRRPALLNWKALHTLVKAVEDANLSRPVYMAHRVLAFTGTRIGNVVEAQWKEFDLDGPQPTWKIPRHKMKVKSAGHIHDHVVYLGPTIVAELKSYKRFAGNRPWLFPSNKTGSHITREALEKAYRTLGYANKHSPHGWRASLSTLARDHGFERDVVELALDHIHDKDIVRAYDRGERLGKRYELMQWWDQRLAQQREVIIPLKREAAQASM